MSPRSKIIRSSIATLAQKTSVQHKRSFRRRLSVVFTRSRKRLIRYGLLAANVAVLGAVFLFIRGSQTSGVTPRQNSVQASRAQQITSPLDQVSSADIAAHVARLTALPESRSVDNHADTFNAQLSTNTALDRPIASKTQVVPTSQKTRKDIANYTVQSGDTVTSIAQKFGVTSDSIRWSNGVNSDSVQVGKVLTIPPISGIVYTVKSGDTIDSLAQHYSANKDAIIEFNDAEIAGLKVGDKIVIPNGVVPVTRSTVSTGYSSTNASFAWGGYTAVYSSNGYDYGWCTWWAAKRRADVGSPIPSNLGNAVTWASLAQRAGLGVDSVPTAGSVAYYRTIGGLGHVGFVEKVNNDGSIWISDMNYFGVSQIDGTSPAGGWGRASYHRVEPGGFSGFYFIH